MTIATATTDAKPGMPITSTPQSARRADTQAGTPASPTAWTLQLDRIVAEQVQAVSLRQLHIEGQGQLQLGLFKQLRGGPMEIFPSHAVFESARVRWGQDEVMRNGQLRIDASIARHAPDQASGLAVLQLTDALIAVHGDTAALDVTRHAQGRHTLATRAGKGRADGELRWIRGALQPGSQLQWRAPLHDSTRTPAALLGELTAQLQVDQDMRLKVSMPEPADAGLTLDADLRVQGRQLPVQSMRSLLPRTSGHARLHWQLSSLRWIAALFPDVDWLTLEGEGLVDADLRIDRGQLAAGSRLQVPHVHAQVGVMGHAITGQASADLRVDADASGQLLPALALQMQQFSIAHTDAPARPFVQGRDLRLDLRTRADARNSSNCALTAVTACSAAICRSSRVSASARAVCASGRVQRGCSSPAWRCAAMWMRICACSAAIYALNSSVSMPAASSCAMSDSPARMDNSAMAGGRASCWTMRACNGDNRLAWMGVYASRCAIWHFWWRCMHATARFRTGCSGWWMQARRS